MFLETILCAVIAGCLLCLCWFLLGKFLTPMPVEGLYVFFVHPDQISKLEQHLRCCRWLRQAGLLRGKICVVTGQPDAATQQLLELLQRQNLTQYLLTKDELMQMIQQDGEMTD